MRLKLWAAFAASTLVGITVFSAPEARADKGDRFGGAEESSRKSAEKESKDSSKDSKEAKSGKGKDSKDKDKEKEKDKGGKRVALSPEGLKFGMSMEAIAKLYDSVFDKEFLPLYKKASPGPETDALDADLKQKKMELRRSKVEFGQTPTGVDQTPLKGEYSYANGESMGRMTLKSGTERYFFFFSDKLWKVYDEYKLVAGGPLGNTFDTAIEALGKRFGAPPKKIAETDSAPQEAQWVGSDMIIRAIDRGNVLAVVYIEKDTQDDLPKLRRNRPKNEHAMDRDVADALKKSGPPEPAKPDPKKKK
jgi:hypothetical protein